MKRWIVIAVSAAAVLLLGGGFFFGYSYLKTNYFIPLQEAEDLNNAYYSAYGEVGNTVTAWAASASRPYGAMIGMEDLTPVSLPESAAAGGAVSDLGALLGRYYRVDVSPGTLLLADMVMDFPQTSDDRAFDVITAFNPIGLQPGDLVDIRVNLPTGEDYVALSRKRVEGIYSNVLKLVMSEYDITVYNSLVVDTTLFRGATVYAAKYLDGSQDPAEEFYPISENVLRIALTDPNITRTIDYETVIARRRELVETMALLDENEILRDMLQAGKNVIPDKIMAGQAAWQTEQDIERARLLEEQLYGGGSAE